MNLTEDLKGHRTPQGNRGMVQMKKVQDLEILGNTKRHTGTLDHRTVIEAGLLMIIIEETEKSLERTHLEIS